MFFHQKIDLKAVIGNAGLLLFVPAMMAFCSIPISLFFKEYFAILPFLFTGIVNFLLGFVFYKLCFRPKKIHLWDAMLSAALGWLLCPIVSAVPYIWVSYLVEGTKLASSGTKFMMIPLNAFFETFSGFTSTGLSMIKEPQLLPYSLQWWRAFTEWVGGVGLIVFVLSFMEPLHKEFRLFYAETRSKELGKSLIETGRMIWLIYIIYTIVFGLLFWLFGMPLWESICHSMTGISTGGFTVSANSFADYTPMIKSLTVLVMLAGAMSFSIHHKILFEKDFMIAWRNIQNRLLYLFAIVGALFVYFLAFPYFTFLDAVFQWVSSLGTCGFSTMNLTLLHPIVKIFLVIGMIIGGASGSTVGGIKIRRLIYLWQAVVLRLRSFTVQKEKKVLKESSKSEPTGVDLPEGHKTERLYEASVLFALWITSIAFGWFWLSYILPQKNGIDLLFDVSSAMSNVGLSAGITGPELPVMGKIILMFLMWLGRLEIIPILILLLSPIVAFARKK